MPEPAESTVGTPGNDEEALRRIDQAAAAVGRVAAERERLVADMDTRLAHAMAVLRDEIGTAGGSGAEVDEERRRAIARRLYWHHREIKAETIAKTLGYRSQNNLLKHMGSFAPGVPCELCGADLHVTSRTKLVHLEAALEGRMPGHGRSPLQCEACQEIEVARRRAEQREAAMQRQREEEALVPASTDDWFAATVMVLHYSDAVYYSGGWLWVDYDFVIRLHDECAVERGASASLRLPEARMIAHAASLALSWDQLAALRTLREHDVSEGPRSLLQRLSRAIENVESHLKTAD